MFYNKILQFNVGSGTFINLDYVMSIRSNSIWS